MTDERTARPDPDTVTQGGMMLRAMCQHCGLVLVGDLDFGWWVHLDTGEKGCSRRANV